MLSHRTKRHEALPITYFAYSGWIIAVVMAVTGLVRLQLGALGWAFTKQLIAVGLAMVVGCIPVAAHKNGVFAQTWLEFIVKRAMPRKAMRVRIPIAAMLRICEWAGLGFYGLAAIVLLVLDHRLFLLFFAALMAYVAAVWLPVQRKPFYVLFGATLLGSWALASGMSYTHLGDWLLNAGSSEALAIFAFLFSTLLVTAEMSDSSTTSNSARRFSALLAVAVAIFLALALRSDNLMREWVPLHRSYFADTAQYVREGHWLLWDVPSLYGFLSIATLAVLPTKNGWESLSLLTAVFLVVQCSTVFVILRWGRSGWRNATFAILFPATTILMDGIARYPLSARLYPQGGMRFFLVTCLLFIIFLSYACREHTARVETLRRIGWAIWCVSLFWSVENGLWATVIWLPYVVLEHVCSRRLDVRKTFSAFFKNALVPLWPAVALPIVAIAIVDAYYKLRLGAYPDWHAYIEFLGFFTTGVVRKIFFVQAFGAGWLLLLFLCAVGSLIVVIVREARWEMLPLAASTWLTVWATSSYFAVEPLDLYAILLLAVLVPAGAIVMHLSRSNFKDTITPLLARFSIAPVAIIAIALALGSPSRLGNMILPFSPSWNVDTSQVFSPISGELAELFKTAGINPFDKVVVPNGEYWTEPTQGIILPFTRLPNGEIHEYSSWLPISPVGMTLLSTGIGHARRTLYIERTLAMSKSGGWLITYREEARCNALSRHLTTLRSYHSVNFEAALCAYKS